MKGFKDIVRADASRIFLNPEEFGETHIINGKEYKIVLEVERRITKGAFAYREGNYRVQKLFYVAAEAFGRLPPVGRNLSLDGKDYIITDAADESGIYSISLEAVRS